MAPSYCVHPPVSSRKRNFSDFCLFRRNKRSTRSFHIYVYMSSCWLLALAKYCAREFSSADSVARQREIGGDRRSKLLRSQPCHTIPSETSRSPRKQPLWKNHNLGWQKLNLISEPAGRRFQLLTTCRSIGSRPSCDATPPPQSLASLSARDAARLPPSPAHLHGERLGHVHLFWGGGG